MKIIRIIFFILLIYAFAIKFIDVFYTCLSLSINTNINILICEKIIPNIVSLIAIGYCIYIMWRKFWCDSSGEQLSE